MFGKLWQSEGGKGGRGAARGFHSWYGFHFPVAHAIRLVALRPPDQPFGHLSLLPRTSLPANEVDDDQLRTLAALRIVPKVDR